MMIWAVTAAVHNMVNGTAAQGDGPKALHGAPHLIVDFDLADTQPPKPRL